MNFTIETAWSNITVDQCKKLIDFMPRGNDKK